MRSRRFDFLSINFSIPFLRQRPLLRNEIPFLHIFCSAAVPFLFRVVSFHLSSMEEKSIEISHKNDTNDERKRDAYAGVCACESEKPNGK